MFFNTPHTIRENLTDSMFVKKANSILSPLRFTSGNLSERLWSLMFYQMLDWFHSMVVYLVIEVLKARPFKNGPDNFSHSEIYIIWLENYRTIKMLIKVSVSSSSSSLDNLRLSLSMKNCSAIEDRS